MTASAQAPPDRRCGRGERGAAAVEAALLMLVLVPMILYAVFFTEVALARLKSREASRYLAWETAAAGAFEGPGPARGDRFERVRRALVDEVMARWGDDLDGATPTALAGRAPAPLTVDARVVAQTTGLENRSLTLLAPGAGEASGPVDARGVGLLRSFGFDRDGYLDARVGVAAHNQLLGSVALIGRRMLARDDLAWTARQTLVAGAGNLADGGEVTDSLQARCESVYCRQVQRMTWAGLEDVLGTIAVDGALAALLRPLGVHSPAVAALASLPLGDPAKQDSAVELSAADPSGHEAMHRHFTNCFKDTFVRESSVLFRVYGRRGPYYLGCPGPGRREGECAYEPR